MSELLRINHVFLIKPTSAAFSNFPPLNLLSLAAFLRVTGYAARVLDLGYPEDVADLQALKDENRPVFFGITATTPEFPEAIRLVRDLKTRFPEVPVVMGGIHVSALGTDALAEAGADFGVCGEGEETLAELVIALAAGGPGADLSGIRGLILRDGDGYHANPARPVMKDIDALLPPAWDLVRSERYFAKPWGILQKRKRTGFIVTSRGCPFKCTFCASNYTMGSTFRGRNPDLVVDEIEALYHTHRIREFLIAEDSFTSDRDRTAAICEEILRRRLDISWRTPNGVRIDSLDPPLVDLMKQSGCYLLGFGLESADSGVLKRANKHMALDRVADTVAMVRRRGIMTFGTFILGLPGETRQSALETIRYAANSDLDIAHFGLYVPFPGSRDFEEMRDRPGLRDWSSYVLFEALPCSDLPPREMKALLRRAYASFYFRPARMRLFTKMFRPAQLREAMRAFYTYVS